MSLILRVDVDKPYGNSNLMRRIASKVTEDYFSIPGIGSYKYLSHLMAFLEYCNAEKIPGFIYHRTCTAPNEKVLELIKAGGHKIGFHAENTRSFDTFMNELNCFRDMLKPMPIETFTKHGSGDLKLGKHHYAPYEPERYKEWAKQADIGFYFGNDICKMAADLEAVNGFYPNMFWMERDYRDANFGQLQQVLEAAKGRDVVVIIHPCNFHSSKIVADDFKELVRLSREQNIAWKVF